MNSEIKNFALIIGAMKCGTTSLFEYLSEHPEISPCSNKEYNFFANNKNYSKGFDYYKSLWNWNSSLHKIALQAPTSHTRITHLDNVNAAENIAKIKAKTNVNFKFIYIMRNPIDRIESHYIHGYIWKFEEAMKPLSQEINSEIIDTSRYAMQIEEYYKRFARDNILLLNFDDLKNDKPNLLKKVCEFLSVDSNYQFQTSHIIHNSNNQRTQINIPGWYLIRRTKLMQSIVNIISDEARQKFHDFFGYKPHIQNNIKLSSDQRQYILNQLQSDLQKLNLDYGFDVSRWGIKI
jgi:hypothetical protein